MLRMPDFDTKNLEAEDRLREGVPGLPLRIGVNRRLPGAPTSCATAGLWSTLPDGMRLWTFDLEVPGAKAVRVHFSEFDLPGGTQLMLYGEGIGRPDVYSGRGPVGKGQFWAAAVSGEVVHLQYQAPSGAQGQPVITFDEISHIYNRPSPDDPPPWLKDGLAQDGSGYSPMSLLPCEKDVNCYTVDTTARDAVGLIEFNNGQEVSCSGVLLADSDPNTYAGYFLTANHCLSTQGVVDTATVYWFYQSYYCNGPFPPQDTLPKSISGTLLATSPTTDFTFIRLADDPHDGQGFAAWATADPSGTVTGIHHPSGGSGTLGTIKHVSFGTLASPLLPACQSFSTQYYWFLHWTTGITELGSSGSPLFALFDSNWRVVGQLYGWCGQSLNCGNPQDYDAVYGKFGVTYTYEETYPNHLPVSYWLNLVTPDDSYEDNDTLAQAAPIARGSHNLELVDFDDYYSIVSLRQGQVTITATYNPANVILELQLLQPYPDGTVIADSNTASGTETVGASLPAGPYVVHAYKVHKWGGDYTLNINQPSTYCDFDLDGDVDMVDFAHMQQCYTGSAVQTDPSCYDASLDGDDRVDAADMALFDACYSGPNVPAQPGCTP